MHNIKRKWTQFAQFCLKTLNIKENRRADTTSTTTREVSKGNISTADRGMDERLYLHYYYTVNNPKDFVKIVDLS